MCTIKPPSYKKILLNIRHNIKALDVGPLDTSEQALSICQKSELSRVSLFPGDRRCRKGSHGEQRQKILEIPSHFWFLCH